MAVTSTPSFGKVYDDEGNEILNEFYSPVNPKDLTVLSGSSFDTKIGYKFRSAAQRELFVILQDIEGTPLTDSAGEPLVALVDGFVTSELTSEKALGVVLPTIPEEKQVFDFTLFGESFDLRRRQIGAAPGGGDIPPYVEITNPQDGYKYISKKDTIEIATGADIYRDIRYGATEFVSGANYQFGQVIYVVAGATIRLYDVIAGSLNDGSFYTAGTTAPTHTSGIVSSNQVDFRFINDTGTIDPDNSEVIVVSTLDGREIESFTIDEINDVIAANGTRTITYFLSRNPTNEIRFDDDNPVSLIKKILTLTRTGTVKVEEVFPSVSEVSTSLLGIDRAETQLGLFSNVSTYGFDPDEFVYYTDNNSIGPAVWTQRETEREGPHYQSRVEEVGNEGALRISSFPVPYTFPYPPLSRSFNADGNDTNGLFNETNWDRWQNWLSLGKTLYERFSNARDLATGENKRKYAQLLTRFLPAINIWDDATFYGNQFYGNSTTTYYRQISIWTETWNFIVAGTLNDPVSNQKINFEYIDSAQPVLRGTGTDTSIGAGSIPSGTPNNGVDPSLPATYLNPYQEQWLNRLWISADPDLGGDPGPLDFRPGYGLVGGQYALLQSRQAFRYQPGRISGYTFGTRATMTKETVGNYAEWGIFNDFDEYVFRREGANFYIVRRSNVHLPLSTRQELGVTDIDGVDDIDLVKYYNKLIAGRTYSIQEIILPREKFNGDSLNGNGPSGYLLTTDEITMYKIEFGWYGAIGLRLYAYIPIESGKARWVVVHTFVIENKLSEPSMGDPFYRFKYEMRIGSQQAPLIDEPQVLYKYGTSMYIDGGDEGTVSVYSQTSDIKNLPFQSGGGNYVSLFGIYPKSNIVSGGQDAQGNPVEIPNKKIIIPKSMSISATAVNPGETNAMAEINFTKCSACTGSSYLYMPDISNGYFNSSRKFKKLPLGAASSKLTLAPIDISIITVESGNRFITSDSNLSYIRNGDYIDEIIDANSVSLLNAGHIIDMKYRGVTGTVTNGGSAYVSGSYDDIPLSGGTGTSITANIVIDSNGLIESVLPTVKGENYTVGDVLSVDPADMYGEQVPGQGIPGTGMQFTVTGVDTTGFRVLSYLDTSIVNTANTAIAGTTITVQPCFILNETERRLFDIEISDLKSKVITTRMWNTYIGNVGEDIEGFLPTTANLLGYIQNDRWNLTEERLLDPSRIVINPSSLVGGVIPTPADFFGDPATETFDAKLDSKSTIVTSPQPLSGPTGVIKWLQNYFKDGTGNTREWEIGFTPFRPTFDQATGELVNWVSPAGQTYTEQCYQYDPITQTYVAYAKEQINLGDDKTVSLDLHPYNTSVSYIGFENGEDWYGRIAPFTEDFRISTPKGTSSGRCAQARLLKQDTITKAVTQIPSSDLNSISRNQFENGSFADDAEYQDYKNSASYFLKISGGGTIYEGTGDPTGGQIAINPEGTLSYIKFFYTSDGSGGIVSSTPQIARFAGKEKQYNDPATGESSVTYRIIPILDNDGADINIKDSVDINGNLLIPATDAGFTIAYNGVEMVSWFSGGYDNSDPDGRYNVPNSYTGGGNNQGVFNFDAFPMYAFFKFRDGAQIRGAELHDIDELNNLSTQNPQWKRNFDTVINKVTGNTESVDRCTYGLASSLRTGQLNVDGVGSTVQNSAIPNDDVVPAAFQQVSRLTSANIDTQGESILRPGSRLTTLYINNETKYFDLEDVFGFDRKVLTPDVVNTEAIFIVGRAIGNTAVDIEINITYIEQL
jgi:hypothetical protein